MITFKQKEYSEYDAMRSLYVEMMRYADGDRRKQPQIINQSALLPILKGNNIVIEKFVISTSFFGKDKYRMYLKIGAKAKLPDQVRLTGEYRAENLGNLSLKITNTEDKKKQKNGGNSYDDDSSSFKSNRNNNNQRNNNFRNNNNSGNRNQRNYSERIKLFGISATFQPNISLERQVLRLKGEVVSYDKAERRLVLDFTSISDAIASLNVLPFGINYKVYLLDV